MRPIIKLVKPDITEIALYISIGFGLLVINNLQRFWAYLSSGISFDEAFSYNDIALTVQNKMLDIESGIDPRFADFTVWMIIGAISITVVLVAQRVLGDTTDEIKHASMLRKTRFRKVVTHDTAYRFALRFAGIILFIIWFRIYFGAIYSGLSQLFFESAINILSLNSILLITLSVIINAVAIYLFVICARLIALRVRITGNN